MRWRNLIISVIEAAQRKSNRTAVVGFVGILQISHKFWGIPEIAVRLQKIRNGAKSRFLYRLLKTNNTPIELVWFKFGVLFTLEAPPGIGPGIKVLQTSALPLGYGAVFSSERGRKSFLFPYGLKIKGRRNRTLILNEKRARFSCP